MRVVLGRGGQCTDECREGVLAKKLMFEAQGNREALKKEGKLIRAVANIIGITPVALIFIGMLVF